MEPKQAADEIQIRAEVLDAERCRFTVDRPVFPAGGSVQYSTKEMAKGSSLAEKLFEIENVTGIMLSDRTIIASKTGNEDWRLVGGKIGRAIRSHLQSEAASLSSALSRKPGTNATLEDQIRMKVQQVLDSQINPSVAGHGGYVSLLDVKGATVYLKMGGGCQGCGMASVTLRQGVERAIRQHVPEVTEILDTTDHAAGRNPYYAPSQK